jgi:hypothetical protein
MPVASDAKQIVFNYVCLHLFLLPHHSSLLHLRTALAYTDTLLPPNEAYLDSLLECRSNRYLAGW